MKRNIAEDGVRIDEDVPNNVWKRQFVVLSGLVWARRTLRRSSRR
jgi:hypothetical protein